MYLTDESVRELKEEGVAADLLIGNNVLTHGLEVVDVEEFPAHGGSLRGYVRHSAAERRSEASEQRDRSRGRVEPLRRREREAEMELLAYYRAFSDRVEEAKRELLEFLIRVRRRGDTVIGYVALGKGSTLLNYCGIRTHFLDYTVDRSDYKQGMYLPGTHIPIHAPSKIAETRLDWVLMLPWNLKREIVDQMSHVREWGGQFVVPIPEPTVLD